MLDSFLEKCLQQLVRPFLQRNLESFGDETHGRGLLRLLDQNRRGVRLDVTDPVQHLAEVFNEWLEYGSLEETGRSTVGLISDERL